MLRASAFFTVVLSLVFSPVRVWGADAPITIPKKGDPGWTVTQVDSSRKAPSGYEGRTDISTITAVGRGSPETEGKMIVARFTLGNEIKTCPNADGTAEGSGEFSLSIDYTDKQPTGVTTQRIQMQTKGKYKGEVGDDAWIENPVKAEIDYTYTRSGSSSNRALGGAFLSPAASNVPQHLTFPFSVGGAMAAPDIGPFSGGDPTAGHYADAYGAGTALVYWAGVYYSIAQTKWRQPRTCVEVAFTPSSNTDRLVPGGKTTVKAEIKTKAGEGVKARFLNAHGYSGGSVSPSEGTSDVGAPMTFIFIAPTQKVNRTGFGVEATSRAGIANGEWYGGLGTDWSGNISLTIITSGDAGANEMQAWSNASVMRLSVDVKDGKGTARGYTSVHNFGLRKVRRATGDGSTTLIEDSSETTDGEVEDESPATVEVVYPTNGTYAVRVGVVFNNKGTTHTQRCNRNTGCTSSLNDLIVLAGAPAIDGKVDDPNHLSGSKTVVGQGVGYQGKGTITTTTTWNLARQGKSQ